MLALLLFYLGSGILLAILSIPLLFMKVKPNPFYGFRVKATMDDAQLWFTTNHYFAKWQLVIGITVLIASTGFYFWPGISVDSYALMCLGVFGVVFLAAMIKSINYMNKIKSPK